MLVAPCTHCCNHILEISYFGKMVNHKISKGGVPPAKPTLLDKLYRPQTNRSSTPQEETSSVSPSTETLHDKPDIALNTFLSEAVTFIEQEIETIESQEKRLAVKVIDLDPSAFSPQETQGKELPIPDMIPTASSDTELLLTCGEPQKRSSIDEILTLSPPLTTSIITPHSTSYSTAPIKGTKRKSQRGLISLPKDLPPKKKIERAFY